MNIVTATLDSAGAGVAAGLIVLLLGTSQRQRLAGRSRAARAPAADQVALRRSALIRPTIAAGGAAVLLIVLGWIAVAISIVCVAATRTGRPIVDERRRRRKAHRAFPDAVERVVLLIHAGLTPHLAVRAACRSVPPAIRPAFDAVVHRLDRGAPLGEALTALTDVLGPRAAAVTDAFGAADRYGLPLEPMLDQLARDARAERRRLGDADARRLPVRLAFPLVTCTLPSFVLVAIAPAVIAALSSLGGTTW